jgi:hypothetical protein
MFIEQYKLMTSQSIVYNTKDVFDLALLNEIDRQEFIKKINANNNSKFYINAIYELSRNDNHKYRNEILDALRKFKGKRSVSIFNIINKIVNDIDSDELFGLIYEYHLKQDYHTLHSMATGKWTINNHASHRIAAFALQDRSLSSQERGSILAKYNNNYFEAKILPLMKDLSLIEKRYGAL